jgi:anthranilate synthase component 1
MDRHASINSQQAVSIQPVCISDVAALDLSKLHQLNPERYPFLLESVAKGGLGRYDILLAFPQSQWVLESAQDVVEFQTLVKREFATQRIASFDCELPFHGGWFAFFSYDYAQVVEPSLRLPPSQFPLAQVTRVPAAVIIDHQKNQAFILSETGYSECIAHIEQDIAEALALPDENRSIEIVTEREEPEEKYLKGVEAIKEYILAGDVFQVNLSRLWQVDLTQTQQPLDVYRALRRHNPAPFAALAQFGDPQSDQAWSIISSSPERLVRYQAPWVETRPIAGTRKRSEDMKRDRALIEELISHPKERAEHIMLIDLERNDLGRICQPGSVEVNELMVVESYQHVHHIVSNVRGRLAAGLDPLDIVHALFPGGTITGCPKVRCMEIIAELEQMPREAYTGSLGYINRDGSMDLNILIRSMVYSKRDAQPSVQFRAGAGIVADSDAANELTETRHKAKGLIRALNPQGGGG